MTEREQTSIPEAEMMPMPTSNLRNYQNRTRGPLTQGTKQNKIRCNEGAEKAACLLNIGVAVAPEAVGRFKACLGKIQSMPNVKDWDKHLSLVMKRQKQESRWRTQRANRVVVENG
ncbi:unnamed protein product [Dovyalis caffra]|uniref:Uncharacterized protein n=1 Tax=Dovyalis caffra TaxID=77055 RepID=A0AAV1SG04_9ROSI|nr:unnamed protein product [Dovyalis caffra]